MIDGSWKGAEDRDRDLADHSSPSPPDRCIGRCAQSVDSIRAERDRDTPAQHRIRLRHVVELDGIQLLARHPDEDLLFDNRNLHEWWLLPECHVCVGGELVALHAGRAGAVSLPDAGVHAAGVRATTRLYAARVRASTRLYAARVHATTGLHAACVHARARLHVTRLSGRLVPQHLRDVHPRPKY